MGKCNFAGCIRTRSLVNGYCRTHTGRRLLQTAKTSAKEVVSSGAVTNEDLKKLITERFDDLHAIVHQLQTENLQLSNQVFELEENVDKLTNENGDLRKAFNEQFFAHDALNQHGRHINGRFINIPEPKLARGEKEDCSAPVIEIAKRMKVSLTANDIERCHRLGKPRTNGTPRPIIVRFSSYRKKKEIMQNKKSLRIPEEEMRDLSILEKKEKLRNNPFIVEDLTPFRGHVFKYVRDWNATHKKFDVVSTDYGQIVVKERNNDTWHRISSTEDFQDAGIDFDAKEFGELF